MSDTIFLYEFQFYDVSAAATSTLRISSEPYMTKPTDTPANTRYDDRIAAESGGGGFERWIFERYSTFGAPAVGDGAIVLNNADGGLDDYKADGFDLRTLTIKTVARGAAYSTATVFATLTVENVEIALDDWTFQVRDPLYKLTLAAQTATFAGTNSGSSDLEGTSDTIQGKIKPFIYGKCYFVEPVLVNHTSLIYACNFDSSGNAIAISSVDAVYDGANALSKDTTIGTSGDFANAAALAAAVIAAGKYATCVALGLIRVQTKPTYVLTADLTEGANAAARTMAQCVKRFLTDRYGITDFDTTSVTDLDTANSSVVGIYIDDATDGLSIITQLLQGDMAFCFPKINGQFYFGRLVDPSGGLSTETITENKSLDAESGFKRLPLSDDGNGLPCWKTIVNYSRYFRALSDTEIAGAVTAQAREAAKQEYRSTSDSDAAVKTAYLSAPVHEVNSLFTSKANADTAAVRMQDVRGVFRDLWVVPVQSYSLHNLGDVITLQNDRYGLSAGKKGVIIGFNLSNITAGIIEYGVLV